MKNQSRSREFDLDRFRRETGIDSDTEAPEIRVEFKQDEVTLSGTVDRDLKRRSGPTSVK